MKNKKLIAAALMTLSKKQLVRTIVQTAKDDLEDWFGQQYNQRQFVEEIQKRLHAAHPNFAPKEPLLRDRIVTVIDRQIAEADMALDKLDAAYAEPTDQPKIHCEDS